MNIYIKKVKNTQGNGYFQIDYNVSQKLKDVFDVVRAVSSYITIFAVGFALFFTYAISEVQITTIPNYSLVLLKILAIILVLFPFILF